MLTSAKLFESVPFVFVAVPAIAARSISTSDWVNQPAAPNAKCVASL